MTSSVLASVDLLSKFRGCMVGALIGDCLGFPFEDVCFSKRSLHAFISNLLNGESTKILPFTDDTSMTRSIARSLIEKGKVDPKDIAIKFVTEYFEDPFSGPRGYGIHVRNVFHALKYSKFEDVFFPATQQFGGSGSYGNGAAMRIAPIALFGNKRTDNYIQNAVEECSNLTHTHPNGRNGAILQCFAVHAALNSNPVNGLVPVDFINHLETKMKSIETEENDSPFCESLEKIRKIYTQKKEDISAEEIADYLGNDITALGSVPTAIYSFLRGIRPLPDFECSNPFVRTIYFAISVGGDTDTIATMAGSIAGAYYGIEAIPDVLQKRCDIIDEVHDLAEKLYTISENSP